MSGTKDDSQKPMLDLIPVEFTIGLAKALTFGAIKYSKHNFRKGIDHSRLLAAAERHLKLELAGVKSDKDSGLDHWMHAAASLAMYAYMKYNKPEFNDLFKYTDEELKKIESLMYGENK